MKALALILLSGLISTSAAMGDGVVVVSESQKVIRDSKTKVIYYLESDLRHIAALAPDGKLLWCCEVVPPPALTGKDAPRPTQVTGFSEKSTDDFLEVTTNPAGIAYGRIDKLTGKYTFEGED